MRTSTRFALTAYLGLVALLSSGVAFASCYINSGNPYWDLLYGYCNTSEHCPPATLCIYIECGDEDCATPIQGRFGQCGTTNDCLFALDHGCVGGASCG